MQNNPNEKKRVHVWVKGRVQGVGFRAHVEYFAAGIGVAGWVRNVGWDTVEAVAEGAQKQIEQFIQLMKTGPRASRVDEIRVEEEPIEGLQDFTVKRSL
ncbi:MAG: acylphosphatase [Chloroflexi bacterium]|nr:acylphosphatase [Chloroflexota bacterium]MCA2002010.1 acylphosphatase [Chloroflexota bacterium]